MTKLRVGDQVLVIAGKDKGKKGNILRLFPYKIKKGKAATGFRVVVEGINFSKKHVRSTQDRPGEIVSKEMPLDASNVRIFNPKTTAMDKIGYKLLADGKKVRIFKSNGEVVGG